VLGVDLAEHHPKMSFMRAHYVKFDVGNKQVGFAQLKKSSTTVVV